MWWSQQRDALSWTSGQILSSHIISEEIGVLRGVQDSRTSPPLKRRVGAVHGCVGEGNYYFF